MDRICDDHVVGVTTPEECIERCAGYNYMGLACPIPNASFECWCCNDLEANSNGTELLSD